MGVGIPTLPASSPPAKPTAAAHLYSDPSSAGTHNRNKLLQTLRPDQEEQ